MSGAFLERLDALHAVYRHYEYANWSLCRFRSASKIEYAADLSLDIDAHGKIEGAVEQSYYVPNVAASAEVVREIVTYLRDTLKLDMRYVTTSVGRMGTRLTIDWRCFGPRRLHEIAAVIGVIETRVFGSGGLKRIADKHGITKVEIDKGPYLRGDQPRRGEDEANAFIGPWLRPVGALHNKGSNATGWARVVPVPHERLVPDAAKWLVAISRGATQAWGMWNIPGFDPTATPEARIPAFDKGIEASPTPCTRLIELFDDDTIDAEIPADVRDELVRLRRRATGLPARKADPDSETTFTDEVILSVLEALDAEPQDKGEYWQIVCPRCGRKGHREATVYKINGNTKCFRFGCNTGQSFIELAVQHGLTHLLPARAQTNVPLRRVALEGAPKPAPQDWGEHVEVISPTCNDLDEITAERRKVFESALTGPQDDVRLVADLSITGTGKTTTTQDFLVEYATRYRVFVPRDEHKESWVSRVPNTLPIAGRRADETCTHPDLAEVTSRKESVEMILCKGCPRRPTPLPADGSPRTTNVANPCEYWMQFDKAPGMNLALSHQHGLADLARLQNDATIDIIDEDPLSAVVSDAHTDLDADELDLFDALFQHEHEGAEGPVEDTSFETPSRIVRRPATENIRIVLERLGEVLAGDPIADADPKLAATGQIADVALARLLFRDPKFRAAVEALTDADLDAHAAAREALREARAGLHRLDRGYYLPLDVAKTWAAPEAGDMIDAVLAFEEWQKPRLVPLVAEPPTQAEVQAFRLPIDALGSLRDGLVEMLRAHEDGRAFTSSIMAFRGAKAGPWTLRVTTPRPLLAKSRKVVVLSATVTPERLRLAFGPPTAKAKWVVFDPKITAREERIQIADRLYGKGTLLGATRTKDRERVFETVSKLVADEHARTGMPVAVIGPSEIMNLYLDRAIGRPLPKHLRFPLRGGSDRARRLEEVHALTEPLHFLAGYAFGVSGSNAFSLPDGRFVRSVILLGAPIPNLGAVAQDHRSLYAGKSEPVYVDAPGAGPMEVERPVVLDWSITHRKVPFAGTSDGESVLVAFNVPGYSDGRANAVLAGIMEGEILQILGRLRYHVSALKSGARPRAYIFSGVAIGDYEVDRVLGLEELRQELGLEAKAPGKRGRPIPDLSPPERLRAEVKKRGRKATLDLLTRGLLGRGTDAGWVETEVRKMFERAGLAEQGCTVPEGHAGPVRAGGFTREDREAVRAAAERFRTGKR